MPLVVPRFIIMTATCVFEFCSAIVMVVEMPLLNKIDEYSAKIIILLPCPTKQNNRLVQIM